MNRHERVAAALKGESVDRVPVSAWGHFYDLEVNVPSFIDAMLSFQKKYDWDYLKLHPRASYHVEGWGYAFEQSGKPGDAPVCTNQPIKKPSDWKQLKPLSNEEGALLQMVKILDRVLLEIGGQVPVIMTVFTPLDVAHKLVDRNTAMLQQHIQNDVEALRKGLEIISETFSRFVRKLVSMGLDGFYFSTKWANDRKMTAEAYAELARPFDLMVIEEARPLWFNILHLCEGFVHLRHMADYPVQVLHWDHHLQGNPGLAEGKHIISQAVGGGVDQNLLATGLPKEVTEQVHAALQETEGHRFILGPGCSIRTAETPDENLKAMRRAVETGL